jgi:hypothetical protein
VLPLYAFWNMDDFSWGETRKVQGETKDEKHGGKQGEFDGSDIMMKTWADWLIAKNFHLQDPKPPGSDDGQSIMEQAIRKPRGVQFSPPRPTSTYQQRPRASMMFGSNPDSLINGAFGESGHYVPTPPMPSAFAFNLSPPSSETSSSISGYTDSSSRSKSSDEFREPSPMMRGKGRKLQSSNRSLLANQSDNSRRLSSIDGGSSRLSHSDNRLSYFPTEVASGNLTLEAISALNDDAGSRLDEKDEGVEGKSSGIVKEDVSQSRMMSMLLNSL